MPPVSVVNLAGDEVAYVEAASVADLWCASLEGSRQFLEGVFSELGEALDAKLDGARFGPLELSPTLQACTVFKAKCAVEVSKGRGFHPECYGMATIYVKISEGVPQLSKLRLRLVNEMPDLCDLKLCEVTNGYSCSDNVLFHFIDRGKAQWLHFPRMADQNLFQTLVRLSKVDQDPPDPPVRAVLEKLDAFRKRSRMEDTAQPCRMVQDLLNKGRDYDAEFPASPTAPPGRALSKSDYASQPSDPLNFYTVLSRQNSASSNAALARRPLTLVEKGEFVCFRPFAFYLGDRELALTDSLRSAQSEEEEEVARKEAAAVSKTKAKRSRSPSLAGRSLGSFEDGASEVASLEEEVKEEELIVHLVVCAGGLGAMERR